jgi:uncharacterized membrane protein SirB2
MLGYELIKLIHVSSVIASFVLFTLRGIWMMQYSANLQRRWVKILPHIVDTVLLTSAIALAVTIQQNPINDPWLTAKVVGLLLYIYLGMIALRFGKTHRTKLIAWVSALAVFIYIALVALTKSVTLNLF